jgi:hypothetical protein
VRVAGRAWHGLLGWSDSVSGGIGIPRWGWRGRCVDMRVWCVCGTREGGGAGVCVKVGART